MANTVIFGEFLQALDRLRARGAIKGPPVSVEAESDPKVAGKVKYRITGHSYGIVQGAIEQRMQEAEDAPGDTYAEFTNPRRLPDGSWTAVGVVFCPIAGDTK